MRRVGGRMRNKDIHLNYQEWVLNQRSHASAMVDKAHHSLIKQLELLRVKFSCTTQSAGENIMRKVGGRMRHRDASNAVIAMRDNHVVAKKKERGEKMMRRVGCRMRFRQASDVMLIWKTNNAEYQKTLRIEGIMNRIGQRLMRRVGGRIRNRAASNLIFVWSTQCRSETQDMMLQLKLSKTAKYATAFTHMQHARSRLERKDLCSRMGSWHMAASESRHVDLKALKKKQHESLLKLGKEVLQRHILLRGISGWRRNQTRLTMNSARSFYQLKVEVKETPSLQMKIPQAGRGYDSDDDDMEGNEVHSRLVQKMLHRADVAYTSKQDLRGNENSVTSISPMARSHLRHASPNTNNQIFSEGLDRLSQEKRQEVTNASRDLVRKLTSDLIKHHSMIVQHSDLAEFPARQGLDQP